MKFDDTDRRPDYGRGLPRLRPSRLGQRRHARGYTQQSLADELGVSLRSVQLWESGKHLPRGKMLGDYADKLAWSISEVIGEESRLDELEVRVSRIEDLLAAVTADDREQFLRALQDALRQGDTHSGTP